MPLLLHASVLLLLLLLHVLLLHLQLHMLLLILLLLVLLLLMLPLQVLLLLLLLLLLLMHVLLHVLLQVMPHVLPLVLPVRSKIPRSIVVGQMTAHTHRCRTRDTMQCPHGGMCSVVPRLIGNGYKIRQITSWCCQESGSIPGIWSGTKDHLKYRHMLSCRVFKRQHMPSLDRSSLRAPRKKGGPELDTA